MSEITEKENPLQFSIIIPVFNEEGSIQATVDSIRQTMGEADLADYELIVVNDGSTDETSRKLKSIDALIITHQTNRGYGASLKTGIRAARGEFIIITDADGSYPVEIIPELIDAMSDQDMVVGARTKQPFHHQIFRKAAKYILQKLASYVVGCRIPDLNSGLRIFRKSIMMKYFRIIPSGFSFTSTLTMAMLSDGYRVKFHPIDYYPRQGQSKIRPFRDTQGFVLLIVRTCLYFSPLRVFIPVSGFLLALAGLKVLYDLIYQPLGRFIITQSVLLISLVAMQIFILGLIADLIVRRAARE
jgi:glycosyltransferase involved in cell wall biosynthesis